MTTKYRMTYNGKRYTFDEHPLEGVVVSEIQTIQRTTSEGQEMTFLISPEIPITVRAFTDKPRKGVILQ